MADEEHLALIRQGSVIWNEWRRNNLTGRPSLNRSDLSRITLNGVDLRWADLSEANLNGADLRLANLTQANLRLADLSGTTLTQASLSGANLNGANLNGANLSRATLKMADLNGADLNGADLTETNFSGAGLRQTSFYNSQLWGTLFNNTYLGTARGLETVRHNGPSSISTDTLVKSQGKIPEAFLRGCGVPDSMIEYLPSLLNAMQPIQFYSCFISYSTKDQDFAQRLYERMQSHHLRVWFAPEEMKAGQKVHEQIDQAIRVHDKLVLVLSENSIQSEWVITEIRKARKAEIREKRRKLFPIGLVDFDSLRDWECFDADTGKDLAVEVREYFIPDFTNWKDHDAFEAMFTRLLEALQAAAEPK